MSWNLREKLLEAFEQLSMSGKKLAIHEVERILQEEKHILGNHYQLKRTQPESVREPTPPNSEIIAQALQIALEYGQASISMFQRRLGIGYADASRIMEELEIKHFVSPAVGSSPRQVLITWDEYQKMFGTR